MLERSALFLNNYKNPELGLKETFPDKPRVILGDDYSHLEQVLGSNIGKTKALAAAQTVNGLAFFPIFAPDEQPSVLK